MIKENQKLLNIFHLIIDSGLVVLSFILAYFLRFDESHSPLILLNIIDGPHGDYLLITEYMQMLIFLVPFYIIAYYFFNLYNPKRSLSRRSELWSLIKANMVGVVYCTTVLYFLNETDYARLFLAIFFILNTLLDFLFRHIVAKTLKRMRRRGKNLKHVLLVGYGRAAEGYIDRILMHPDWGY